MARRLPVLVAAPLIVVAAALRGCGGGRDEPKRAPPVAAPPPVSPWEPRPGDEVPVPGGQVVVHLESEPGKLNSLIYPDAWGYYVTMHMIHETLVREDPRPPYAYQPGLAERWEVSPDKLTYTFHLRDGVRWHDGQPFTSRDVKFTFEKMFDPHVSAEGPRGTYGSLGCNTWDTPDDRTFRLFCKKPHFLFLTNIDELPILPAHAMGDGDFNEHERNHRPLGTGPYKFDHWTPGSEIVLVRNDDYWGRKGYLDRIVYQYVENPHTAVQLAGKGEIDFVSRVRELDQPTVRSDPKFTANFAQLVHSPNAFYALQFNNERPMFRDRRVRRAMAHLFDADTILQSIMNGLGTHIATIYYDGIPGWHGDLIPYPFDDERARQLLDEAGWKDTDGDGVRDKDGKPLRFTFLYPTISLSVGRWVTGYQQALRKAGVQMEIGTLEWPVFLERMRGHKFDMMAMSNSFLSARMDVFEVYHSSQAKNGYNYANFKNAEMDGLLEAMRSELDESKRTPLDLRIQELAYEELPFIPLFRPQLVAIVHKRIHGVTTSPEWYQLNEWWIPKRLQGQAAPKAK